MINLILAYFIFIGVVSGLFYPLTSPFRKDITQKLREFQSDAKEPDVFHYFSYFVFHPFSAIFIFLLSPLLIYTRFNKDLVDYICSKMCFKNVGNGNYDFIYSIPPFKQIQEELAEIKSKKEE